ncbi:hypothetical protein [Escherichia coli]|uniref:hypothetical protein n=1 Tax=Escherichia coli TaxID=562 RepID=UPI001863B2F7|nr:hypothetical protein [Escherichia coli]
MNRESVWNIEPVTHDEKPNNPTGCDGGEPLLFRSVNRQFVAERPDQLWVADFTYGVPGVQGGHGCLNEPRVCLEY